MRLKKGWEYDHVFRTGSRSKGELVRLLFVQAPDSCTRVGFAVGKRQGKAYVRNRGRRILREGVRRLLPWMKGPYWYVFSLRTAGLSAGSREVYYDMAKLLKGLGLLNDVWPGEKWDLEKDRSDN
ncbi:ribonuclease P protein component [Aminobacterium mobile]|uniref:ribonuclease P protein component n=1 Tax=Aminobacterium mobile TaxID=81467 RepID=UPI0004646246|nr:ribonuclease P protein component [Aminobacterium mobile]